MIHLYAIHTEHLTHRKQLLGTTLKALQESGVNLKTTIITKDDPATIDTKLIEARLKYDQTGDSDFDKLLQPLCIEEISNILKHEEAWRAISNSPVDSLNLVIEDDTLIINDGHKRLKQFLETIKSSTWDIVLLGLAHPESETKVGLEPIHKTKDKFKIIPNKEAYLLTPKGAKILLENSQIIRFTVRTLISYLGFTDKLMSLYPSSRLTADASKLGIPSSIHSNNLLILNAEYMELWKAFSDSAPINYDKITKVYKSVEQNCSPDIMHLYSVLLHKLGKNKEATAIMEEAIVQQQKQQGLLTARSDLLNNAISIYQKTQEDLPELLKVKSRYEGLLK